MANLNPIYNFSGDTLERKDGKLCSIVTKKIAKTTNAKSKKSFFNISRF